MGIQGGGALGWWDCQDELLVGTIEAVGTVGVIGKFGGIVGTLGVLN